MIPVSTHCPESQVISKDIEKMYKWNKSDMKRSWEGEKKTPCLFERSMLWWTWSSLLEMPWSFPWHDRQRLRRCWVVTCCGKWLADMCRWFFSYFLHNSTHPPDQGEGIGKGGKCWKESSEINGIHWDVGKKLCRFPGNVHCCWRWAPLLQFANLRCGQLARCN